MSYDLVNREAIRPGDLICRWTPELVGKLIRKVTKAAWNHDAIILSTDGGATIGDALMRGGCQRTPLFNWERGCVNDGHRIIVLRPAHATAQHGEQAAMYWLEHIFGKSYDHVAIWRLALKWLVGDWLSGKVGLESSFWCTEGVRDAWHKGACIDPWWPKINPTPGTTTKRLIIGRFREVANSLTEAGMKYRVAI